MYGAQLPHAESLTDAEMTELGEVSLLATHLEIPFIEFSANSQLCRLVDGGYVVNRPTMVHHPILRGSNDRTQHLFIDCSYFTLLQYPTLEQTFRVDGTMSPAELCPGMWLSDFKDLAFSQLSTGVLKSKQQLTEFEAVWGEDRVGSKNQLSKIVEAMAKAEVAGALDVLSLCPFFEGDWNDDIAVYRHLATRSYLGTCTELPLLRPRAAASEANNDVQAANKTVSATEQGLSLKRPPFALMGEAGANPHPKSISARKRKAAADDQVQPRKTLKFKMPSSRGQEPSSEVSEWLAYKPPRPRGAVPAEEAGDDFYSDSSESPSHNVPAVPRVQTTVVLECAGQQLLTWPRDDVRSNICTRCQNPQSTPFHSPTQIQ